MTSHFVEVTSSLNFFGIILFLLSCLVTDPSFMSISLLEECNFCNINESGWFGKGLPSENGN